MNIKFPKLDKITKKLEAKAITNLDIKVDVSHVEISKLSLIQKLLLTRLVSLGVVNGPNNIEYLLFGLRASDIHKIVIDKDKKEIIFYVRLVYEEHKQKKA